MPEELRVDFDSSQLVFEFNRKAAQFDNALEFVESDALLDSQVALQVDFVVPGEDCHQLL